IRGLLSHYGTLLYIEDNGDGSMMDTITKWQWMKKSDGCAGTVHWATANTCLPSGWRLPTIQELYTLCREDGTTTGLDINAEDWYYCNGHAVDRWSQIKDDGFDVQSDYHWYYWSSTTHTSSTTFIWYVGMSDGVVSYGDNYYYSNYVWPVRSGH
ncbi:hypothetical protein MBAV_004231, partial [Candidatus Magnetobacterium bavaricum]